MTDAAQGTAERRDGMTIATAGWDGLEARNHVYREVLRAYVDAINRRDVDGLVALFAADAVIEDPYGGTRHNIRGHADIRAFYSFVVAKTRLELVMVTGSGGNAAAMAIRAHVGNDRMENISIAQFDADDRIIRYTTYWGPGDRHAPTLTP
jgi:steroid delta-isomerase